MMIGGRLFVPSALFLAVPAALFALAGLHGQATLADPTLLLATAAAVAWLAAYPLRISPSDDFPLVIVPVVVALGVGRPLIAAAGALAGLALAASTETDRWGGARAIEEGTALTGAVLAAALLPFVPYRLGDLFVAAFAYAAIRTPLVATRIARNEGMTWGRAFVVVAGGCGTPFVISILLALATGAVERIWLPETSRVALSALPLLAGGVVLHVFHPQSMSGREERRVLATTAVLANAMDVKDSRTGLHSQDVAQLSKRIARTVGVSERLAHDAFMAGLLHDIGKVAVPDAILQKPGALSPEEWDVMRSHVVDSAEMVASIAGLSRIAPMVRASHEHYDGSGYPDGLRGEEIPLAARIVAIADTYHALTNDRVYRPRRSTEAALAELERCSGTQFDPALVGALRDAVRGSAGAAATPAPATKPAPAWLTVLRRPAFALLWFGEMVSFLGDEVFFIAITLWVYALTGSAVVLAAALSAGYVAQAGFSFLAGTVADRVDRRAVVAISDVGRAAVVAALPFVLPKSLPAGLVLLAVLNVGSVFFRAAVTALLPSIATLEELPAINALFQTTERIAEIVGGVLGAAAVLTLGYAGVMFADAGSFLVSACCVLLMPLAWGAGLGSRRGVTFKADLKSGLRYLWQTPFQRYFALLILPGYLTLAFEALRAPMVVHTAHLSPGAYGVVTSTLGVGKLAVALTLAGLTRRWATPNLAVFAYVLAGFGVAVFASAPWFLGLIVGTFIFSIGNMMSYIVNTTLVMQVTPLPMLGRVLGNRQMLLFGTRLISALALGGVADAASPQVALWIMAGACITGVTFVWVLTGRYVVVPSPAFPALPARGAQSVADAGQ